MVRATFTESIEMGNRILFEDQSSEYSGNVYYRFDTHRFSIQKQWSKIVKHLKMFREVVIKMEG